MYVSIYTHMCVMLVTMSVVTVVITICLSFCCNSYCCYYNRSSFQLMSRPDPCPPPSPSAGCPALAVQDLPTPPSHPLQEGLQGFLSPGKSSLEARVTSHRKKEKLDHLTIRIHICVYIYTYIH